MATDNALEGQKNLSPESGIFVNTGNFSRSGKMQAHNGPEVGVFGPLESRKNFFNQRVNDAFRIMGCSAFYATYNNRIHTKRIVIQQSRHGVIACSFHFEICKTKFSITNLSSIRTHVAKQVGITNRYAHRSPLGRKKSGCCDRVTPYHSGSDAVAEA